MATTVTVSLIQIFISRFDPVLSAIIARQYHIVFGIWLRHAKHFTDGQANNRSASENKLQH